MPRKEKGYEIKPLYVKNDKGKTTHIYLDIKIYESILKEIKEFEKIKKKIKKRVR